jgi:vancomycin permeability regulator SanA
MHKKRGPRLKKWLLLLLCLFVAGGLSLAFINLYIKAETKHAIVSPEEAASLRADCILVLGAWGQENGRPCPMLEDRLNGGIALYEAGASGKLLMSGDHGRKGYDEVGVMKRYALDAGVPSEDVFKDHAGFSTYESLYRARDVFQVQSVVIVTQEYHLYRALYIAQRLGLHAVGVASDPREYAGQGYREAREILARAKDFFQCIFWPKPTYLGEAIPVIGNGDLTNDESDSPDSAGHPKA